MSLCGLADLPDNASMTKQKVHLRVHKPVEDDRRPCIVRGGRLDSTVFPGWGPRI